MIIEHSGDFKVVDPKTKEVRYDSVGSSYYLGATEGSLITTSTKESILDLLKGKTFEDIHRILDDVFEEVKIKAKY